MGGGGVRALAARLVLSVHPSRVGIVALVPPRIQDVYKRQLCDPASQMKKIEELMQAEIRLRA